MKAISDMKVRAAIQIYHRCTTNCIGYPGTICFILLRYFEVAFCLNALYIQSTDPYE
jgi:hypothetical protein